MVLTISIVDRESLPEMDISEIRISQDLTTISMNDYRALRYNIEDCGYSAPIVVWKDKSNTVWCVSGSETLRVLKIMRGQGWVIPKIPVRLTLDGYVSSEVLPSLDYY